MPWFKSVSLALVPLSIRSIFVRQPIVLMPFISIYLASFKASEVETSMLAGMAQRMMVLGSSIQLLVSLQTTQQISFLWPSIGTLVIPGRSTSVKLGQDFHSTDIAILLSQIFLFLPQILSVSSYIVFFTSLKSVKLLPGTSSNLHTGSLRRGWVDNLISKGLLVTIPLPLGKKSRPTICYSKELFPALCSPTTTILGKLISLSSPRSLSRSTRVTSARLSPSRLLSDIKSTNKSTVTQ